MRCQSRPYESAWNVQYTDVDFKKTGKYALPAALYLINNLIYYTVLPLTSPSLLQPQKNVYAWYSLLGLCAGLVVFNFPSKPHDGSGELVGAWYLAPAAGLIISCLSALACINSETTIKEGDFWESQAYLYCWGIIFAAIAYPLLPSSGYQHGRLETTTFEVTGVVLALVAITAGTGLVLRARDNILKVIGTAASLVTIAASQFFLLPELRASTFTTWKVCGGGLVRTATWCYNHYSQEPWPLLDPAYEAIPRENAETESSLPMPRISLSISDEEAEKGNAGSEARDVLDHTLRQDATKVVLCLIFTAFVTYEVTLRQTG